MSDASWLVVLFVASSVCAAYSGWQVLCPMRLRRVRVIWLTSQHFRARADVWYWRTVFLLAAVSSSYLLATSSPWRASPSSFIMIDERGMPVVGSLSRRLSADSLPPALFPRVNRVGNKALSFGFTTKASTAWDL